ncbi:uncharacterized protein LOC124202883 [Daphnia pulex]|uniref:uncharacterized protein LOC124202883 n=1 Tax=Daphnia pulex TaxID=6669 RepID=UPI001EDF6FB3|nr:uncharacterized protein LOC124202883 [Daphnia pulex]
MMNKYVSHFTVSLFLFPLLSITCGSSIRSSLTAEENSHPFLIRKIDNLKQRYTGNRDPFQDTTQESQIEDTSNNNAPLMSENEEFLPVLEGKKGSDNNIVLINPRKVKSSSVAVAPIAPNPERRLYYPSQPVDQPKYRTDTHRYGRASRETYHYHLANNNSPLRLFDSAPLQPKQMGFPPIANTRENLGKQINWNAKVGRAHRSFYDVMTA